MSELSRSLVDAAARRLAARDVADRDMDAFETECEYAEKQHYLGMGAVAVAAVLETLAAHYEGPGSLMGAGSLRRLAEETRAGSDR